MRKISLDKLDLLFSEISKAYALFLPVDTNGGAKFSKWQEGTVLSDALNTNRSAKDFFFPQTENLVDFKVEGKKVEIIDNRCDREDFVIFGVRGCDALSFEVLDKVFLSEPVDTFYKNRRDHAIIMSMACNKPAETCFCKTFGVDCADPMGDIVCYKTDADLLMSAKTEKGEKLLKALESITEECADNSASEVINTIHSRYEKLPFANLSVQKFGAGKTDEFFDDPAWEELSSACLGCGTCTFICPTCQCYDIKDFNTGNGVKRFRCWDSCMYSDFTKMSAGQPRLTQKERFRQRFMHKLVYYPTNNDGMFSCVGCGRCVAKCPIQMNIVKVMKKLGGKA